jgi:hypothetical protein
MSGRKILLGAGIFLGILLATGIVIGGIAYLVNWLWNMTIGDGNTPSSNLGGAIVFGLVVLIFFILWDKYDNSSGMSESYLTIERKFLLFSAVVVLIIGAIYLAWAMLNPQSEFEKCVSIYTSNGFSTWSAEEQCSK